MVYVQGGLVSANHVPDHNTISNNVNEVFSDTNSGETARILVSQASMNTPGTGYAYNDTLTVTTGTGTAATATVTSISTIANQTEADFSVYNNGGNFSSGNDITMTDGTLIHVDLATGGNVDEFTIVSSSTSGTASNNPTISQSTTTGSGTGFSITLANSNQQVHQTTVATGGDYTVAPSLTNVPTTGGTGTGATLDLILGGADFGYGQTQQSNSVNVGDTITASQWTAIFDSIHKSAGHQSATSVGNVPSSVVPGDIIAVFDDPSAGLLPVIDNVRDNRLSINPANLTTTTLGSKLQSTRPDTTTWTNQLIHELTVTFTSYDAGRYFFNTGGEIHMSAERAVGNGSGDATQNSNWDILLAQVGTVSFGINETVNDGTQGTGSSIGFYDLTGSYQQIYVHNGAYGTDQYKVEASASGGLGTSGVFNFKITFTSDAAVQTIGGILDSNIDEKRATGTVSVPSPVFATTTEITAGT